MYKIVNIKEISFWEKLQLYFVTPEYEVYDDGERIIKTGMKKMRGNTYIIFQHQLRNGYMCPICKGNYTNWGVHQCEERREVLQ